MASFHKDRFKGNTVLFKPSKFKTIVIDAVNDSDPQQKIISTIENHEIEDCVIKIIYSVSPEQVHSINVGKLKEKLTRTSFCSITPVVVQNPSRTNLPELNATFYKSPLKALDKYLELKPDLDKPELMKKAQLLLEELR
ncbi:MAG: hypothetical protein AB1782_19615 [Cyanobacteriota bacterium]